MDARTLKALRGSIRKWEGIVAGRVADEGTANCPLCLLFNTDDMDEDESCKKCPVFKVTGISGCAGTPYEQWSNLHPGNMPYAIEEEEQEKAAKDELDFLKSLLPKKARN